ncbi:type II secretion system protein [Oceanimonas pelagia]|uniref:Type II secretion system protein n=1 Tax=Oceanimonas pelagia TaxID=3028314 RepID=A0AA50KSK0_9GAMM|nr:type II secretion system protein [Oceanimonas pelagia]WMC12297.1 type II secretion system protein [Oceanimonas pelagia]
MKRAAGFTLIELVIVIVILGILGAVAAPRFLNLQGDAYSANLKALKSSMETASTLANSKAIIQGLDNQGRDADADDAPVELKYNDAGEEVTVSIVYGYPTAEEDTGIKSLLDFDATYNTNVTDDGVFEIYPANRAENCKVTYTEPDSFGKRPTIAIVDDKC